MPGVIKINGVDYDVDERRSNSLIVDGWGWDRRFLGVTSMKVARRYEPEVEPAEEPPVDLKKAVAYKLHLMGKNNREIGEALDVDTKKVSRWINAAYDKGLMDKLEHPREFGVRLNCTCRSNPLDPDGAPLVCVVCNASSRDYHPRLHARPLPKDRKPPKADGLKGGTDADD